MTIICRIRRHFGNRCPCGVCTIWREWIEIELDEIRKEIAHRIRHITGVYR